MTYNLTENQQNLARFIVEHVRSGQLLETFEVVAHHGNRAFTLHSVDKKLDCSDFWTVQDLDILADAGLLRSAVEEHLDRTAMYFRKDMGLVKVKKHFCTLKAMIYKAVDSNFAEPSPATVLATLDNPHPPEITISLKRLREKFPDEKKVGFLIMRFANDQPYRHIVDAVKQTAKDAGIEVIRADENQFHDNLWENVQTHMHGCSFGIAIYERIAFEQPNANVGLEVGYMMAMNKPVLLLKDRTAQTLQTDLAGKLYKEFDPHNPADTIPTQLERWLRDKGIVVGS